MSAPASLLDASDSVLILIDHQPNQIANVHSHEPTMVINNVTALAKAAEAFGVPTVLTTVVARTGGALLQQVQEVFPDQEPIDRTTINTWEDQRVVDRVRETGRTKLVIAGLWTEMCVAMPTLHAIEDGYDVTVVADASGGTTVESHETAMARMVQAGAHPMTWFAVLAEWQRDWANAATLPSVVDILHHHGGAAGVAYAWEMQLLAERPDGDGIVR